MPDPLDRKLAALNEIEAPDLWGEASTPGRPSSPLPPGPPRGRRIAIASFALMVFAGSAALVAFGRGGEGLPRGSSTPTVSTSGLVAGGTLLCTVTSDGLVSPGQSLPLTFSVENVSDVAQDVSRQSGTFTYAIEGSDGSRYDTTEARALGGPFVEPEHLQPGREWSSPANGIPIQFPGPLTITPSCLDTTLAPITVRVAGSGNAPSAQGSVQRAAAAASGLFDRCMPPPDGTPVIGVVSPPSGSPRMESRCSATFEAYPGFSVVTFLVVAPATAGEVHVNARIPQAGDIELPADPTNDATAEAILWRFVVTQDSAVSVYGVSVDRTHTRDVIAQDWYVSSTGWEGPGGSRCGGSLYSGGGFEGVDVEFANVCG